MSCLYNVLTFPCLAISDPALVFDESGHFLIYPTIFGIKVVNTHSNKVVRLIGKSEPQRFMNIALYQGAPKKKSNMTMV